MKCSFVDERVEFFSVLSEKLGSEFVLQPARGEDHEQLSSSEVILVGLPSPDQAHYAGSLATLQKLTRNPMGVPVIALLAAPNRQVMRTVLASGAYDYFVETSSLEELRIVLRRAAQFSELRRELERVKRSVPNMSDFAGIVGTDARMRAIFALASKVAATDANVLITGESGTGKELLAQAIHKASPRMSKPFVAVACSSLPETLIEAELFGHEKGAFTGAISVRQGRFEAAERGTIFLDEIGDLTPALQVKLLRVLQERKLERRDDVPLLAHDFLQRYSQRHKREVRRISPAALHALQEYSWPGNVRELQNVMERAVVVCDGLEVRIEHLPSTFSAWGEADECSSFEDEVRSFKRRLIQRTLMECDNNKVQAARSLKIARSSLHRLIDELEIGSDAPGMVH
jgi:DNA-binding NtrC family response regulator